MDISYPRLEVKTPSAESTRSLVFPKGRSIPSTTRNSPGPLAVVSFQPSCCCRAAKIDGPAGSLATASARAVRRRSAPLDAGGVHHDPRLGDSTARRLRDLPAPARRRTRAACPARVRCAVRQPGRVAAGHRHESPGRHVFASFPITNPARSQVSVVSARFTAVYAPENPHPVPVGQIHEDAGGESRNSQERHPPHIAQSRGLQHQPREQERAGHQAQHL